MIFNIHLQLSPTTGSFNEQVAKIAPTWKLYRAIREWEDGGCFIKTPGPCLSLLIKFYLIILEILSKKELLSFRSDVLNCLLPFMSHIFQYLHLLDVPHSMLHQALAKQFLEINLNVNIHLYKWKNCVDSCKYEVISK